MAATREPGLREIILGKAQDLMTQKGFPGTSLADISLAAGVSRGTLFYYFPSKESLVLAIAAEHVEAISRELSEILGDSPDTDAVEQALGLLTDRLLADGLRSRLHLALVSEAACGNQELGLRLKEMYRNWTAAIEKALRALLGTESLRGAEGLITLLDGLVIRTVLGWGSPTEKDGVIRLFRGLLRES